MFYYKSLGATEYTYLFCFLRDALLYTQKDPTSWLFGY